MTSSIPPQLLTGREQTAAQSLAPSTRIHPEGLNGQPSIGNITNQSGHHLLLRAVHCQNNLAGIRIRMPGPIVLP